MEIFQWKQPKLDLLNSVILLLISPQINTSPLVVQSPETTSLIAHLVVQRTKQLSQSTQNIQFIPSFHSK